MKKQWMLLGVLAFALVGLMTSSTQAVFVQCPGGDPGAQTNCKGPQGTTDDADLVNGSNEPDAIAAQGGNDIAFGNGGDDNVFGGDGNDVLFGGPGSDQLRGNDGDDMLFGGPDGVVPGVIYDFQELRGNDGNDRFIVNVSDISTCMIIQGGNGLDTVLLNGFGPFRAEEPFGLQPGYGNGWILVVDPITEGLIAIEVDEDDPANNTERVFGLANPNVTFIAGNQPALPEECNP